MANSSFQGNDGEACHYQEQTTAKTAPKAKARKEQLSERQMSLQDRLAFLEAKKSELDSFFKNDVWEADSMANPESSLHPEVIEMGRWLTTSQSTIDHARVQRPRCTQWDDRHRSTNPE